MALNRHVQSKKLAALLDVSPRTIRHWATNPVNPLPGKRINGLWLFDCTKVEQWMNEMQTETEDLDRIVSEMLENQ